jgi:glycosyltransferase involved in cell wall biosynthesis
MLTGRRVVVDGHNLLMPKGTGISTYARNLVAALDHLGASVEILAPVQFHPSRHWPELTEVRFLEGRGARSSPVWAQPLRDAQDLLHSFAPGRPVPLRLQGIGSTEGRHALPSAVSFQLAYRLIERAEAHCFVLGREMELKLDQRPDVFHRSYHHPFRIKGATNIVTIHDLIPLRLPHTTLDDKRSTFRILRRVAETADHIVTVSEHSRRDIISLLGVSEDRVTNTYQAVEMKESVLARSAEDVAGALEAIFGLEYREYFLFFGAIEPKKNISRLIDAFLGSGVRRPLIIVGAEAWLAEGDMDRINDERLQTLRIVGREIRKESRVQHIKYLPRDLLMTLVQGARAVTFPSLYEGFGLPVLESMLLGTPVLTSNISSIPEVVGDAALLIDPYDAQSIAHGLRTLDGDADLRASLASRGTVQATRFSVDGYQARLDDLYSRLL